MAVPNSSSDAVAAAAASRAAADPPPPPAADGRPSVPDRSSWRCCLMAPSMPDRDRHALRPSAAPNPVANSSSGSAARRRAKGMPMTAQTSVAEPDGACSSASAASRRNDHVSAPSECRTYPMAGCLSRDTTWRRSRASKAAPSAAPTSITPAKADTRISSSRSLVVRSAGVTRNRSEAKQEGKLGVVAKEKSGRKDGVRRGRDLIKRRRTPTRLSGGGTRNPRARRMRHTQHR